MNLQEKFNKNWFTVTGDVCFSMEKEFQKYIVTQESELRLVFNTYGGRTDNALNIVDMINLWRKFTKGKVYGYCIGRCSSNGLTILSACDKEYRESAENTRFLFHSASVKIDAKQAKGLDFVTKTLKMHWENITKASQQQAKGFNIPISKMYEMEEAGDEHSYLFTAQEMLELGIIARIVDSPTNL